ncbi:MAG: MFS transporter [Planctomycetota bacterium]
MSDTPQPPPSPALSAGRTARGIRDFRIYAALTFAFAWIPIVYTAFTVDRSFTPTQYLQLWAAYYTAMVIAELPWGWVADRWGHRPLLVAGPLWLAGCFALLGHTDSFRVCWWAMAATGSGHAMISGADSAYLYELLVGAGRRRDALHEETVAHRWRLFGVSILDVAGGLVAFAFGTVIAFDLSVAVMLAAAYMAWRLPSPPPMTVLKRPRVLAGLAAGMRMKGVLAVLFWYVAVFVLLRLGFQLYQPTLIAAGAEDLRLHGLTLGVLNLVAGLSAFFVLRVHTRHGERATSTFVLLLLAVSFAGLSLVGNLVVALLFCLQQVSFAFLQPIGRTALNHRIPTEHRASMLSAQSMAARLGFAVVLVLGDWDAALADWLPATYGTLAAVAVGAALVVALTWPGRPRGLETTHPD